MKQLGLKDRYKKDITKKGFGKGIFKGLELVQLVKDNDTCITDSDSDSDIEIINTTEI